MRHIKLFAALGFFLTLAVFAVPSARADVNDFTITHFSSDQTLSRGDAQGTLHIIESIDVMFSDNNHGIIRAIPDDYNGQPLHLHVNSVTSKSGAPTYTDQSFSNGNVVLKIGDPNRTVTGNQNYVIDYTVENVISFYSDHDELYWDVNGDQWSQPATVVDVKLHLPNGLTLSQDIPQCFMGAYGENQQNCSITHTSSEVDSKVSNVPAGQTLTYVVGFTKGYFQPQTTSEKVKDNLNPLLSLIVLPIAAIIGGFTWWWRKGRDAKGRGVIVPEYQPPKGVLPIVAGTLLDFRTDNRDITATIIDLAIRKYIRIHEIVQDRKIFKDKISYELELLHPDKSALSTYESQLLSSMFTRQEPGEIMKLGEVNSSLYAVASDIRKQVPKSLRATGFIAQSTNKYGVYLIGSVAVISSILAIIFGKQSPENVAEIIIGAVLSVVMISVFWLFMSARTAAGTQLREQLLGLKMYMELTEKERLAMMQAPNAPYAENHNEPKRTVELFEKLLPYAIVMGVEKEWAKQFESMYKTTPGWYDGSNISTFNSVYVANSLSSSLGQAINTSFTPPSSSGSSGFGGGGFSGGGGGGGGGGGW